ncbi:MAG TPA: YbaN family protein [Planctomycetota bacterium]|nr:hypothetical protein [Planctomycetaceae bacterium]HJM55725.1 YbaN family protein [Planctomycetota bacterium]
MKRQFFLVCGLISLVLGIIGAFVPLLPTTPFLILAAACFARSSPKLHRWLTTHSVFGSILSNWESHGAISFNVKLIATVLTCALVSFSLATMQLGTLPTVLVLLAIAWVLAFIWTRPSTGDL